MLQMKHVKYKINDRSTFWIEQLSITQRSSWVFIGDNGSGKSTLARSLSDKQSHLSGHVVNDFKSIGYLSFEKLRQLIEDERQRNNTDLLSENEDDIGLFTSEVIQQSIQNNKRCQSLAKHFNIETLLNKRFKYLSTGEMRKALLCQQFMQESDLLIFDEPFESLDSDSRKQLSQFLDKIVAEGTTIILFVNRINDIPDFVQHIGIIANNQLAITGSHSDWLAGGGLNQLLQVGQLQPIRLPMPDTPVAVLPDNEARIILNNVSVRYHNNAIINGLTWQIDANQHWQIVGPNGAGKSTLLSLITGDHPQGYCNDLTLFGRKRGSGETIWDIKRHIGYVSSNFHLDYRVSCTIKQVILSGYFDTIGLYQPVNDRQNKLTNEWLQLLDLSKQAEQPFRSLSWGTQRLILIVRALVKHPTLLILDEPLQGLDHFNRQRVKYWIDLLINQGNTQLLFVSHHAEDAPNCITHRLRFVLNNETNYQYEIEQMK